MGAAKPSSRKADLAAAAVITLTVLAFYVPPLVSGRDLLDKPALIDVSFNVMPNIHWMAEAWKAGTFPLWNQHTTCGAPHLAYAHSGGLYLPAVALFTHFPYVRAYSLVIIIHSIIAALLFYCVMRQRGSSPFFSAAAALTFIYSGIFFGMLYAIMLIESICGFLLLWISLHELFKRPALIPFIGAVLGVVWCVLPGDLELFTYGSITLVLVIFLDSGRQPRELMRRAVIFCLPFAAGLLVVSPLFFTSVENIHFSIRGPLMPWPLSIQTIPPTWPLFLPTWIFPFRYYSGLSQVSSFNSGFPPLFEGAFIPPLMLAAIALSLGRPGKRTLPLAWIVLLAIMLAGALPAASGLFAQLPLLSKMKVSLKILLFLQLIGLIMVFELLEVAGGNGGKISKWIPSAVMIAGGAGIVIAQHWCVHAPERLGLGALAVIAGSAALSGRLPRRWTAGAVLAALICAEILSLSWRSFPRTDARDFEAPAALMPLARSLEPVSRFAVFEQLIPNGPDAPAQLMGTFEVASGACGLVGPSRVLPARIFIYLSLLYRELVYHDPSGENILAGWTMTNPGTLARDRMHLFNLAGVSTIVSRDLAIPFSSPYSLLRGNALSSSGAVAQEAPQFRDGELVLSGPGRFEVNLSAEPGDNLSLSGTSHSAGWLAAVEKGEDGKPGISYCRRREAGNPVSAVSPLYGIGGKSKLGLIWLPGGDSQGTASLKALDIVNDRKPFRRVLSEGDLEAFVNNHASERAFVAHEAVVIPDTQALLARLSDPSKFDTGEQVLLSVLPEEAREAAAAGGVPSRIQDVVRITSYSSQRIEMQAGLGRPGFLVLTDTYFPGWKARVKSEGGKEARIMPADYAFRAIALSAGRSEIVWTYQPVSFRVGLWAGVASSIFLTIIAVIAAARALRRGLPVEPASPMR